MSAAASKIESLLRSNPRVEEVALESMGIDDLGPLLAPLSQLSRLRKLSLARNNLISLPDDLSALRNIETLDLSGNPVGGLQSVIRGLYCLTHLKHLMIDLPFETDEDEIIVSLHTLESFNGTPLTDTFDDDAAPPPASVAPPGAARATASQPPAVKPAWTAGSTPRQPSSPGRSAPGSAPVVGAKTRWDDSDMSQVQRLYQAANSVSGRVVNKSEFDEYTRNVVTHLHTLLTGEEDPFKRESEILKAKRIMFEYCFEEIVRSSHRFDPNLSQVLGVLQDTYGKLLENYEVLVRNVSSDKERKLDVMKTDMQHAIEEIEQLMQQIDGRGGADSGKNQQWEQEKKSLNEELGWLRAENEKLQARLRQVDLGRGTPSKSAGGTGNISLGQGQNSPPQQQAPRPSIGAKVLTLRQLRDAIEDIYASKSKFDIKCAETHLPRETMEQHMYTYLNQRYGLKHLILEWATAIVQGVKKYSAEDNDVAVFGKILRNEIDEEFRFVQRQLKETVHELLRVYLKGRYPLKSDEDILTLLKRRVAGSVLEEEWVDIVKYMYNTEDSVTIIMRIKDLLRQRAAPRRAPSSTRRSASNAQPAKEDTSIAYNEFVRILLDFQLEGHERFLARFVRFFKQYDTDRNGIVNEHEFRLLLRQVDSTKTEEEIDALLDMIDPHNNQLITFSECVTYLSSELVRMMKDESR